MTEEGFGNELGFLWEDHENEYMSTWANLSNNNSDQNYSSAGDQSAGHEDQGKKTDMPPPSVGSEGGQNGNITSSRDKGKGVLVEGPTGNRKRTARSSGVSRNNIIIVDNDCNNNNNNNGKNVVIGGGESDHEIHIWTERERRKKMRNMFSNLHALLPQLPSKADKSTIVDEAVNYIKTLEQTLQKLQNQKLDQNQNHSSTLLLTPPNTITTNTTFTNNSIISEPSHSHLINNNIIINNPQQNNLSNITTYHDHHQYQTSDQSCNDMLINNNNVGSIMDNNNSNNNNDDMSNNPCSNTSNSSQVQFQTWTSSNVVLNVSGEEAHISVCSAKKPGLFSSICYVLENHKIALLSAHLSSDGLRNMYLIHAHYASSNGASDQFMEAFNSVEEVFKHAVGEIVMWVAS